MSDEYEFYQGLVLRQLIVGSGLSLIVRPFVREGRINAFVINGKFGVGSQSILRSGCPPGDLLSRSIKLLTC